MDASIRRPATGIQPEIDAVVFDLGKVLLDWDPRYYYAQHFSDRAALEDFVGQVLAHQWILDMDAGKPCALAIAERQKAFPQHAGLIGLWIEGWPAMLRGEIQGTARIVQQLKQQGLRLYALTNFSAETFPIALQRCPSLALFEDIVVSGEIGLVKPDSRIYDYTAQRCRLGPQRTLFIDDNADNVRAAQKAGWHALQFLSPEKLQAALADFGLLPGERARAGKG